MYIPHLKSTSVVYLSAEEWQADALLVWDNKRLPLTLQSPDKNWSQLGSLNKYVDTLYQVALGIVYNCNVLLKKVLYILYCTC